MTQLRHIARSISNKLRNWLIIIDCHWPSPMFLLSVKMSLPDRLNHVIVVRRIWRCDVSSWKYHIYSQQQQQQWHTGAHIGIHLDGVSSRLDFIKYQASLDDTLLYWSGQIYIYLDLWPHTEKLFNNAHSNVEYICQGKWVPASAGKAKAGVVHSVRGWMRGVQVKLWDPLRTRAIPQRLRGVFTTRRYTHPRLPLPYLTKFHWKPSTQ